MKNKFKDLILKYKEGHKLTYVITISLFCILSSIPYTINSDNYFNIILVIIGASLFALMVSLIIVIGLGYYGLIYKHTISGIVKEIDKYRTPGNRAISMSTDISYQIGQYVLVLKFIIDAKQTSHSITNKSLRKGFKEMLKYIKSNPNKFSKVVGG